MSAEMRGIADRLRQVMQESGIGPTQWSESAALSRPALTTLLKRLDAGNGHPSADTMLRLARTAGVTVDWLLTGEEPRERGA